MIPRDNLGWRATTHAGTAARTLHGVAPGRRAEGRKTLLPKRPDLFKLPNCCVPPRPIVLPQSHPLPRWLGPALLLLGLLLSSPLAHAMNVALPMRQLQHTAWSAKDGAPGEIFVITQTRDGFLWLGSSTGVVRFDGLHFTPLKQITGTALPSDDIWALAPMADGSLWIGMGLHGIVRLDHGHLQFWNEAQGIGKSPVLAIAMAPDGHPLAATGQGLLELDQGRWSLLPGAPGEIAQTVFVDSKQRIWIAGRTHIWLRQAGSTHFIDTGIAAGDVIQFNEGADGTIWVVDTSRSVHPVWSEQKQLLDTGTEIQVGSNGIAFDADGGLWIGSLGDGLRRAGTPAKLYGTAVPRFGKQVDAYTSVDGLTADFVYSVFRDDEDDIWVGTSRGLDRFRASTVVSVPLPSDYHALLMQPAADGGLWVGSASRPLIEVSADGHVRDTGEGIGQSAAQVIGDDQWWGDEPWIIHRHGQQQDRIRLPPSADHTQISNLLLDGRKRLWVTLNGIGALVHDDGHWQSFNAAQALPTANIMASYADPRGLIWLAFANNQLVSVDGDQTRIHAPPDSPAVGDPRVITSHDDHLYLGGRNGIAVQIGPHFLPLRPQTGHALRDVIGLAFSADGALWIADGDGIGRIAPVDLSTWLQAPGAQIEVRRFGYQDGLPAPIQQGSQHPGAVLARDGRIWFSTIDGLAWVDPSHLPPNPPAPRVHLTGVIHDHQPRRPAPAMEFAPGTRQIGFTYTATELGTPELTRFHYRLLGLDPQWQRVGDRRETYFSNLGPGHYRFEVSASLDEQHWSTHADSIDFTIQPAFYQTRWFALLVAALVLMLIWGLHHLRLRQVAARLELMHHERHTERERIARELHDTLLQSVQGLLLRADVAASGLPADAPGRAALDHSIERANQMLEEGRDRITALRAPRADGSLVETLAAFADEHSRELTADEIPVLHLDTRGIVRELQPLAAEELLQLGTEALRNVYRHAHARNVSLRLEFQRRGLRLSIEDDGRGIPPEVLDAGGRDKHFGLVGMRERARRINAKLELSSNALGTRILLRVPARSAYRR